MGSSTTARCPTLLAIFWREGGPLDINEYLYLGNQRMARALNFSSSYYYYADYLGTSRASVDENGNKCYDADYFPWGNEQDVFVNTCTQNYKFNGKELDPDMGVYDFGARFFQDGIARFYQPDFNEYSSHPSPVPYAKLNNPQSLNLYTYVLDNPLSLRDPDGHLFNGSGPGSGGCQQSGANPACGGPSETANPIPAQNQQVQRDQTGTLDKDKFVNYMDEHSKGTGEYGGKCATACRKGLEAGGLDTSDHPANAKDYGPFLEKHGASVVSKDDYKPEKGDIAVFQGGEQRNKSGHVQVYDGKGWVSDTKQPNFEPRHNYPGGYEIYRFPD